MQLRGELQVAYMDETWVWRYYSFQKGIAPIGTTRGGVKSGKGDRLIVVDAITNDGLLWCDDSEVIASHRGISKNDLLLSDSDVQSFPTALWTWVYQKSGDYHDAIDYANFQNWVNNRFIPTWKR